MRRPHSYEDRQLRIRADEYLTTEEKLLVTGYYCKSAQATERGCFYFERADFVHSCSASSINVRLPQLGHKTAQAKAAVEVTAEKGSG